MPIIYINQGKPNERKIGFADTENRIFTKWIYGSKHIFRTLDAIGIDAKYFTNVLFPNNYIIRVVDRENRKVYNITAEKFKKYGEFYHFKKEAEDDHAQIFCSRKFWEVPKPKTEEEQLKEDAQKGIYG